MGEYVIINVAKEFTPKLENAYYTSGPYSAAQFRREHVVPALNQVRDTDRQVWIDFNGVQKTSLTFLDEVFAGLQRQEGFTSAFLNHYLRFVEPETGKTKDILACVRVCLKNP